MEWQLAAICGAFNCTPREALQQDYALSLDILTMRAYDAALSKEEQGEKLTQSDYRVIVPLERAAGIGGG